MILVCFANQDFGVSVAWLHGRRLDFVDVAVWLGGLGVFGEGGEFFEDGEVAAGEAGLEVPEADEGCGFVLQELVGVDGGDVGGAGGGELGI